MLGLLRSTINTDLLHNFWVYCYNYTILLVVIVANFLLYLIYKLNHTIDKHRKWLSAESHGTYSSRIKGSREIEDVKCYTTSVFTINDYFFNRITCHNFFLTKNLLFYNTVNCKFIPQCPKASHFIQKWTFLFHTY